MSSPFIRPEDRIPGQYLGQSVPPLPQMPVIEPPLHQQIAPIPLWLQEQITPKQAAKARRRATYVRQQQGHSLIIHLLLGGLVLWIPAIYYTFSPNHFWHA